MDQKDNSGALFRNEKKEHDRQPDYTGTCVIDGKEKRISAWLNEARTGRKYFSMKFSDPRPKQERPDPYKPDDVPRQTYGPGKDFDDEIPF